MIKLFTAIGFAALTVLGVALVPIAVMVCLSRWAFDTIVTAWEAIHR